MKVLVGGIDESNYNYRKIKGFIDAFSLRFSTVHTLGSSNAVSSALKDNRFDIAFGEFDDVELLAKGNIKNCVFWGNIDIDWVASIANSHPNKNFVLAPKSVMHIESVTSEFISTRGNLYQKIGSEGQDLHRLSHLFKQSTKINDFTYRISKNFVYTFLPCSLSQVYTPLKAEYDICYFGTPYNRPKVAAVLAALLAKGYRVKSSMIDGFIHPEDCIQLYRKSVCNITQQVQPVELEHPVRLGESSGCGCATFVIDTMMSSNYNDILVPNFMIAESIEQIESYISLNRDLEKRIRISNEFTSTYENAVERIMQSVNIMNNS